MRAIKWENNMLYLLNQTLLPQKEEWIECQNAKRVEEAIKKLEVRGAPAIGVAAAFGLVLAAQNSNGNRELFLQQAASLRASRPTAVNLMWAIDSLLEKINLIEDENLSSFLEKEAQKILLEDIETNKRIGDNGASLFPSSATILTICNTGSLATAGYGTALGVIRKLFELKKLNHVYACETRPLLQGSRLTAYELMADQIPSTLITDNMAGWTMKTKKIDAVIAGADRITLNGDTANKIGTYSLAVLAKAHNIPFYIAAPQSTFDLTITDGSMIPIEERNPDEVRKLGDTWIAPANMNVFNPAFDVTPNELISGIITDQGVLKSPFLEKISQWKDEHK